MTTGRMETFSDGVLAIVITIMVMQLVVPISHDIHAIFDMWPKLLSYLLSYIYIGIYWNNHHHVMKLVKFVTGKILWCNLIFLFWVSLIPFTTAWLGESLFD